MGTKIVKVRIGSTVYEKTVEVADAPEVKAPPAPEPEPEVVEDEETKPKRRGRPRKTTDES